MTDEETGITYSVVERLENGSMWTYIIAEVPTIDAWQNLEASGDRVFPDDPAAADEPPAPGDPENILTTPIITLEGSTLRVELTIPAQGGTTPSAEDDPFGMTAIMMAFIQTSYEIQMPGQLGEHNGQIDTLTGNPVWLIDPTSTEPLEIHVESTVE